MYSIHLQLPYHYSQPLYQEKLQVRRSITSTIRTLPLLCLVARLLCIETDKSSVIRIGTLSVSAYHNIPCNNNYPYDHRPYTGRRCNHQSTTEAKPKNRKGANLSQTHLYSSSDPDDTNIDSIDTLNTKEITMTRVRKDIDSNQQQEQEAPGVNNVNRTRNDVVVRKTWNPFRLAILRLRMTEPAMTSSLNYGSYNNNDTFNCAYCHTPLFPVYAKYNSGTGWPSFWRTYNTTSVAYFKEWDGRIECTCSNCNSHLGHVFMDGPYVSQLSMDQQVHASSSPSTDPRLSSQPQRLPRFCMNGLALIYSKNIQE